LITRFGLDDALDCDLLAPYYSTALDELQNRGTM
jgi:hypothetical protein